MLKNKNKNEHHCILCGRKHTKVTQAKFAPFLMERMFQNRTVPTRLITCKKCNFSYSQYRPTDNEMGLLYKDYRGNEYQQQRQKFEPNYTPEFNHLLGSVGTNQLKKERIELTIKKNVELDKITSILDYGGDRGQFIPTDAQKAKKYVYDISDVPTVMNVERIVDKESLFKNKYQVIMCCHLLEHLSQPKEVIKDLYDLLEDNGYIYIELPAENIKNWKSDNFYWIHEHINNFKLETLIYFGKLYPDLCLIDLIKENGVIAAMLHKNSSRLLKLKCNIKMNLILMLYGIENIIGFIKKLAAIFKILTA